MLTFALAIALAQTPQHRLFLQPNLPTGVLEAFEALPVAGMGATAPCACVAPSGARGEVFTFTRTGNATCSKSGRSASVADGDFVVCTGNQPRVAASGGALGVYAEGAATNSALQSAALCNAAWSDVGTPVCTADQAVGPFGGAATLDQLTDNDGAAFEGRSQAIVTTSATRHTVSAWVKGSGSASITLVGTGSSTGDCTGTVTGLSSVFSKQVTCTSSAAYAGTLTGVTVTIRVGTAASDTGTIQAGDVDHHVNAPKWTSHVPTAGSASTRNAEAGYFTIPVPFSPACIGATVDVSFPDSAAVATNRRILRVDSNGSDVDRFETFWSSSSFVASFVSVSSSAQQRDSSAGLSPVPGVHRIVGWRTPSSTQAIIGDGAETSGATALGAFPGLNRVYIGTYTAAGFELEGIISRIAVGKLATGCR